MVQSLYSSLPSKPGVYLFLDKDGKVIYVGKAKDLKKRVSSYFTKNDHDLKTKLLVEHIRGVNHIVVLSEVEAFLLESALIKQYKPYYNIKLTDDKSYPYVQISKGESPYISIVRKIALTPEMKKHNDFYGPFVEAGALKVVLKLLRRIFPYQSVRNHAKRKCLYFHLGLCPCVPAIHENLTQYKKNLRSLKQILEGKKETVLKNLIKEREALSAQEKFEEAAIVQSRIDALERLTSPVYEPFKYIENPNAHAVREEEENTSLFEILKKHGVPMESLRRIECYDISNFQGDSATGSMTVFINGSATKSEYRKFKIRRVKGINDFAMHQEVLARRLRHQEWEYPQLLIIDGGKGQVSSAMQVLAHMNIHIPVIGLAKKFETIIIPEKEGAVMKFKEVRVPLSTPALNLMRRIRDEAHRFAITYHRVLRSKKTYS
ncbi:MAG: GIY-YIG nuclease family protein [Candidatus Levyibacteriota bacterium]